MNKFYGTGVAMITPFNTDGSVDYQGLKKLINFLIDDGVDYLVSLGTTGESATLRKEEKKEIWKVTAETVSGRVPLVAGIGSNSTDDVMYSLKHFDSTGYDAILSVSPYYNKPTQEGIYQHYRKVSEASPLPVMLYNVPSRTGSNVSAETILCLAHDCDNIFAVKEAAGSFDQLNKIIKDKPADFLVISGDDPVTLPFISLGAVGVISVVGNAFPKIVSDMVRLCLDNRFEEARSLHYSLIEITRLFFAEGNPAGVKAALKQLDICGDYVRLPLVNVSDDIFFKIKSELKGLLEIN